MATSGVVLEGITEMRYGSLEGALIHNSKQQMGQIAESWQSGNTKEVVGGGETQTLTHR